MSCSTVVNESKAEVEVIIDEDENGHALVWVGGKIKTLVRIMVKRIKLTRKQDKQMYHHLQDVHCNMQFTQDKTAIKCQNTVTLIQRCFRQYYRTRK